MNKVIKSKGDTTLEFDAETGAYWVVTTICGNKARLFVGCDRVHAENEWKWYANANAAA